MFPKDEGLVRTELRSCLIILRLLGFVLCTALYDMMIAHPYPYHYHMDLLLLLLCIHSVTLTIDFDLHLTFPAVHFYFFFLFFGRAGGKIVIPYITQITKRRNETSTYHIEYSSGIIENKK